MHGKRSYNARVYLMRNWLRTGCIRCAPPSYPVRPVGKHRFKSIGGTA